MSLAICVKIMLYTLIGSGKMIQIKGAVKFPITLDSTTWIFDDRKVSIEDLEKVYLMVQNQSTLKIIMNGIVLS